MTTSVSVQRPELMIYNTLTKTRERFCTVDPENKKVLFYLCGPTVYGDIHIGNARPLVFFDTVRRFLSWYGYEVLFTRNITDVDDKILARAQEEKKAPLTFAAHYDSQFHLICDQLKLLPPTFEPRVSLFIPEIIAFISRLIEKQVAYVGTDGSVFFSVRAYARYGQLSGKPLTDMRAGARVAIDPHKREPEDFALWKPQKPEENLAWDSPWGPGRPGWHIECSAMALATLGPEIDIHAGGIDLIHPHHENERAQTESDSERVFAHYWMHNAFVTLQSEKMAKSTGNVFYAHLFLEQYGAETLKALLLSHHYRSPLDASAAMIREAQLWVHRIYKVLAHAQSAGIGSPPAHEDTLPQGKDLESFHEEWVASFCDDFNTPRVFALVGQALTECEKALIGKRKDLRAERWFRAIQNILGILNLGQEEPHLFLERFREQLVLQRGLDLKAILQKVKERQDFREAHHFEAADRLRAELEAWGIGVQDRGKTSEWEVIL